MYKTFQVVDVMLDEENPRFTDPVSSQADAINSLLEGGRDKLLALARDIAERGELDPTNPPIVMRENDEVIVLEGNRRFAALKLLRKPELAKAASTQRAIERIRAEVEASGMEPYGPSEVDCHVVDNREEARHWIELRHTGLNEGVGTDPWNSYQNNTFRRRRGSAEDRAWLVIRAALTEFADDHSLVEDVRKVRDTKFTNLSRLLGREYVRKAFRIEVHDDAVTFASESPLYVDVLRTVFADLVQMSVDEIKTAEAQDAYADRVLAEVSKSHPEGTPGGEGNGGTSGGAPSGGSGSSGTSGSDGSGSGGSSSGGSSTGGADPGGSTNGGSTSAGAGTSGRTRTRTPRVVNKVFYGLNLQNLSSRTSAVLKQAQTVKIADAPSVCAVMVRVIVELAVTEVGVGRGWFKESEALKKKIRKTLLNLDPNAENAMKRDKDLEMAWIRSQSGDGDGLAVDEMNAYVHNFMAQPDGERVRNLCAAFLPMLVKLNALEGESEAS